MSLITILEKTVSADKAELEAAQQYLEQASQQNLPEFLKQLSEVLKHGGNSPVVRMQAGLQLKNALYSKEPAIQQQYKQRWLLIPEETYRAYIKKNVLETLGTETSRPSSAAQCVAYIACAELPHQMWPELIQVLVRNVTTPGSTEMLRGASLEAVGYICQDIEPDVLQPQSNEILTAIVHGMKKEETSAHVRLAATNALLNSLEFTRGNFDIESERHYIMQVVCEATQASDMGIRVAALQCLVKIMSLYYHYMEHYMGPALFAITMEAMKSENDEVGLQGIEFWSTVCDEEVDLAIEASDAQEEGRPPERTSRFYAKGALQYLVPILTQMLAKQEEYDDDDEWNPCKAAGVCLMLMATCCEDDIIQHVLPFILEHIKSADWRYRDAAVMAFGCILEGPQQDSLKPLVEQALPTLTELLKDGSVIVRDTAAWTVGRVCEMLPDLVINERFLSPLLLALVEGLLSEPRVAANVCWALSSLAEAAYEVVELSEDQTEPDTYCLSLYFEPIVQRLLETTDRLDGNQNNLRSAAYEALMEFVKNSPKDCYDAVRKTTVIILQRLQGVLSMEGHIASNDRAQYNDLQSLLCATLQSVLRKVTKEDAPQISDPIMEALLRMLSTTGEKAGGVQEDAMLAVSTLVEVLGDGFTKYVEAFKPFLCQALKNYEEYQLCLAAVGVCGDMCRALANKILPYCDEIMVLLLEGLGNELVHRSVKPQILSVFGDLSLAIGPEFKKYLEVVLGTLQQATQVSVDKTDFDMVDYLNELRESCLEAYTGIIQGLRGDNKEAINPDVNLIQGHVPYMMQFLELVASDGTLTDTVLSACCGLLGDLCTTFGVIVVPLVDSEAIQSLLVRGRKSKTGKTRLTATWASREIKKIKTAAA